MKTALQLLSEYWVTAPGSAAEGRYFPKQLLLAGPDKLGFNCAKAEKIWGKKEMEDQAKTTTEQEQGRSSCLIETTS